MSFRIDNALKLQCVNPNRKSWTQLRRFAIGEQNFAAEVLANEREGFAERTARLSIGYIAPEERGKFFAGMGVWMKDEVSEERFDLARGQAEHLRAAFDLKYTQQMQAERRRGRARRLASHDCPLLYLHLSIDPEDCQKGNCQ